MIGVTATVKMDGVYAALRRLRRLELIETYRALRGPARWDQRDHDNNRVAPDGKWPALAPSTVARRKNKRGRDKNGRRRSWPTKLLGRLPTALESVANQHALIVRSRVRPWVIVHQAGGWAGHGARIPRRQFLWISRWLKGKVKDAFQAALLKAWAGR